ncbi:MAG: MBL fold metallo-hydrolase, partial [Proteobacteria bacterium]|nr:MBL fold metallo-hydrolase [Pseudomonadota bacterium]
MEVYTRRPTPDEVTALAHALDLRAPALSALANEAIEVADGPWTVGDLTVHRVTTGYPSHCYVIVAPSGTCAIIDPGDDAIVDEVASYATSGRRHPVAILVTHGHHDHDGGVARLQRRLSVPVHVHEADTGNLTNLDTSVLRLHGDPGRRYGIEDLEWHALPTPGHTAGSTTWVFPSAGVGAAFCGDTMFASTYAAYDALSERMKAFLSGLTATHDGARVFGPGTPKSSHPVIIRHPESGRRGIFVNWDFTSHINELPRSESDAILKFLYRHIGRDEWACRFRWRPHSIAFWDNRCAQHKALWDYWPNVR